MADPSAAVIDAAASRADEIARTTGRLAIGGILVGAFGVALLVLVPVPAIGLGVASVALPLGVLYGVAWRRAVTARSSIRNGPYRYARVAGWCRPPDGCNYAIFLKPDADRPDAVLRLPVRREMKSEGYAWVAGSLLPSSQSGVALFDDTGLLATGHIVESSTATKRWDRRQTDPGPWVQRPPDDWLPPGGS